MDQGTHRIGDSLRPRLSVLGFPAPHAFLWSLNVCAVSSGRCATVNLTSLHCLCGQFLKHSPQLASAFWGHLLGMQLLAHPGLSAAQPPASSVSLRIV